MRPTDRAEQGEKGWKPTKDFLSLGAKSRGSDTPEGKIRRSTLKA